jgi:hypothetical protein
VLHQAVRAVSKKRPKSLMLDIPFNFFFFLAIVVPQLIWGMPGRPFGGSRPAGLEGDRDCTNSNFKANIQIHIDWQNDTSLFL